VPASLTALSPFVLQNGVPVLQTNQAGNRLRFTVAKGNRSTLVNVLYGPQLLPSQARTSATAC
jgi:hypothetical protein